MKRTVTTLTAATLTLGFAASSHAAIVAGDQVLIDFGKTGQETGGNFNNVNESAQTPVGTSERFTASDTTPLAGNLIRNSDGAATGVDLFFTEDSDPDSDTGIGIGGADNPAAATFSGYPVSASRDTLFLAEDFAEFEIRDLDPSLTYNLQFFGSVPSSFERDPTFYDVDTDGNGTLDATDSFDPAEALENGEAGVNFATFLDITPTAGGVITFRMREDTNSLSSGNVGHLNVLELNAIPEPASLALLGLGGLMLLPRRKRA